MSDDMWFVPPALPDDAIPLSAVIVSSYLDKNGDKYTMLSVRGTMSEIEVYGMLQKGITKVMINDIETGGTS